MRSILQTAILLNLIFLGSVCFALDNPDAPNYLSAFQAQSVSYERAIDAAQNGKTAAEARGKYAKFLDNELNKTYQILLEKLSPEQRKQLQSSQREWLEYRDRESEFINANWNQDNFGSSSAISRFTYQTSVTRQRIEQFFEYLKNY